VSLLQLAETNGIVTPPSTSSHTATIDDPIVALSVFIANCLMFFLFFRTHDDQQQGKEGQQQLNKETQVSYPILERDTSSIQQHSYWLFQGIILHQYISYPVVK
jgi:hypothetical protein